MKEKIKVLVIGMSPNLAGIEKYIYGLVNHADMSKFKFDLLVTTNEKIAFEDEFVSMGCSIIRICPRDKNWLKSNLELKNVLQNGKYDFIHYNLMSLSWYEPITYANKYTSSKIIVHSHAAGLGDNASIVTKLLHSIGVKKLDRISYLPAACGNAAGKFMFKNTNFSIFDNGINIDEYKFDNNFRTDLRKQLNINDSTIVIGLTARLEMQKNTLFLVDILKEYMKYNSDSKLVLTGDGSLKEEIINKIKEYGIEKNVLLLGSRKDANKIYSIYDYFVMPSLYEGLSISLIEAQVNGLKCFTSDEVDHDSNIAGDVEFISLKNDAAYWAKRIFECECRRNIDAYKSFPAKYNSTKSYGKVYEFYFKNM